jgi:transcription initiation factor IIE alpha subunit
MKKNKTSDWKLNETFYNVIKNRFSDLKDKLDKNLKDKETLKFECSKCKFIYPLEKAAHIGYHCTRCDDRPKLGEKAAE